MSESESESNPGVLLQRQKKISDATEVLYSNLVKSINKFVVSKIHSDEESGFVQNYPSEEARLVQILTSRKDLAPSTLSTYLAALSWEFKKSAQDRDCNEALDLISSFQKKVKSAAMKQAKSRVPKKISSQELNLVIEELVAAQVNGGVWAARAQVWLQATFYTNIRPREWPYAGWSDATKTVIRIGKGEQRREVSGLNVGSSKKTRGNSASSRFQNFPEIPVASETVRATIELQLKLMNEHVLSGAQSISKYRSNVSQAIRRAFKQLRMQDRDQESGRLHYDDDS